MCSGRGCASSSCMREEEGKKVEVEREIEEVTKQEEILRLADKVGGIDQCWV